MNERNFLTAFDDEDSSEESTEAPKHEEKGNSKYCVTCRCGSVPCRRTWSVTLTTGEKFYEGDYLPDNAPINDIADLLANHGNAIERTE